MKYDSISAGLDERIGNKHVKHEAKGSTRHVGKVILSDRSESCAVPEYLDVSLEKITCSCLSKSSVIHVQDALSYEVYPFEDVFRGDNVLKVYEFIVGNCIVESVVVCSAVRLYAYEMINEFEIRNEFEVFLEAFAALIRLVKGLPHSLDDDDVCQRVDLDAEIQSVSCLE